MIAGSRHATKTRRSKLHASPLQFIIRTFAEGYLVRYTLRELRMKKRKECGNLEIWGFGNLYSWPGCVVRKERPRVSSTLVEKMGIAIWGGGFGSAILDWGWKEGMHVVKVTFCLCSSHRAAYVMKGHFL
jgi:hypothetical protein